MENAAIEPECQTTSLLSNNYLQSPCNQSNNNCRIEEKALAPYLGQTMLADSTYLNRPHVGDVHSKYLSSTKLVEAESSNAANKFTSIESLLTTSLEKEVCGTTSQRKSSGVFTEGLYCSTMEEKPGSRLDCGLTQGTNSFRPTLASMKFTGTYDRELFPSTSSFGSTIFAYPEWPPSKITPEHYSSEAPDCSRYWNMGAPYDKQLQRQTCPGLVPGVYDECFVSGASGQNTFLTYEQPKQKQRLYQPYLTESEVSSSYATPTPSIQPAAAGIGEIPHESETFALPSAGSLSFPIKSEAVTGGKLPEKSSSCPGSYELCNTGNFSTLSDNSGHFYDDTRQTGSTADGSDRLPSLVGLVAGKCETQTAGNFSEGSSEEAKCAAAMQVSPAVYCANCPDQTTGARDIVLSQSLYSSLYNTTGGGSKRSDTNISFACSTADSSAKSHQGDHTTLTNSERNSNEFSNYAQRRNVEKITHSKMAEGHASVSSGEDDRHLIGHSVNEEQTCNPRESCRYWQNIPTSGASVLSPSNLISKVASDSKNQNKSATSTEGHIPAGME